MATVTEEKESSQSDAANGNSTKEGVEKPKRPDNLCCYSLEECNFEKLKGFDFCHIHILEDKASPFKPCSFISKTNGKKCQNPAPNVPDQDKTYCLIHTRDSDLRKAVEERSKKKKRKQEDREEHPESSLVTKEAHSRQSTNGKNLAKRPRMTEGENKRDEMLRVDSSWHGDYESDAESLDNEIDDPLRHAGVWTAEEVTKVCRDKLLRLRSLYMAQFERLKHVYKNKRRKYLLAKKASEEGGTLGMKQESYSAFDMATRKYNRRYRMDALLRQQGKEKRSGAASRGHSQTQPNQRCTHYTDGNRCGAKVIPSTKFCIKHICHDPNQLLFLPCSHLLGGDERCGKAVPNVLSHDKCIFHLPHVRELSGDNLENVLHQAKELQIMKDKEKEERQRAALERRESVTMNSIVSKTQGTSDCALPPELKVEPKVLSSCHASSIFTTSSEKPSGPPTTPVSRDSHIDSSVTSPSLLVKPPQSPTTNLQIRIEPSRKPEIVFTDRPAQENTNCLTAGASSSTKEKTQASDGSPVQIQATLVEAKRHSSCSIASQSIVRRLLQ